MMLLPLRGRLRRGAVEYMLHVDRKIRLMLIDSELLPYLAAEIIMTSRLHEISHLLAAQSQSIQAHIIYLRIRQIATAQILFNTPNYLLRISHIFICQTT